MSSAFDGLRTILGNSAVAVPEVEVAAVEPPVSTPTPPEPSVEEDIPGLAELDRGVYRGTASNKPPDPSAALDALDRGLGERTSLDDPASLHVDANVFADAPPRTGRMASSAPRVATVAVAREVSGWAAVAIMAFGLVLGGAAALAVFHDEVSQIVVSWNHR